MSYYYYLYYPGSYNDKHRSMYLQRQKDRSLQSWYDWSELTTEAMCPKIYDVTMQFACSLPARVIYVDKFFNAFFVFYFGLRVSALRRKGELQTIWEQLGFFHLFLWLFSAFGMWFSPAFLQHPPAHTLAMSVCMPLKHGIHWSGLSSASLGQTIGLCIMLRCH